MIFYRNILMQINQNLVFYHWAQHVSLLILYSIKNHLKHLKILKTLYMKEIELLDFLLKTGATILAGFCMGFERQIKGKPAGLKTNTLVALGAMVFVSISLLFENAEGTDMTRIIGQIVVGVGFLGAGVIFQHQNQTQVAGLATAATIWCSAAAGCLAAMGLFLPLLVFTSMVIGINIFFGFLNNKVSDGISDN